MTHWFNGNGQSETDCGPTRVRKMSNLRVRRTSSHERYGSGRFSFCCCSCSRRQDVEKDEIAHSRVDGGHPQSLPLEICQEGQNSVTDPSGHDSWSPNDVAQKLMEIERSYERRQKYQSIFKDAPLYQIYNERVALKESEMEAERMKGLKGYVPKVQSNFDGEGSNELHFKDDTIQPIDNDEPFDGGYEHSAELSKGGIGATDLTQLDKEFLSLKPDSLSRSRHESESARVPRSSPVIKDHRSRTSSGASSPSPHRSKSLRPPNKPPLLSPEGMHRFAAEIAGTGPNRVMWSKMPEVVNLRLSENLSSAEKKLQEALFEIITSEASYYRSLSVLIEVFYKAPAMQPGSPGSVLTPVDKHHLFSNVLEIHVTSENFLRAMEACFRKDPMLVSLCGIIYQHAETKFDAYVNYVQNQMYQTRTLEKLLKQASAAMVIKQLQEQPQCGSLDLNSFLLLPLQRVTRLRLLVATVMHYAPKNTPVYRSGLIALAALERVLAECDAKKSYMEQKERIMNLCTLLEYKLDAKSVATESRMIVKEGEIRVVTVSQHSGSAFQRKFSSIRRQKVISANLFLFNDLLLIAKKRGNRLLVDASCPLPYLRAEVPDRSSDFAIKKFYPAGAADVSVSDPSVQMPPTPLYNGDHSPSLKHFGSLKSERPPLVTSHSLSESPTIYPFRILMQEPQRATSVYILQAKSLVERERWVDAISPSRYGVPNDLLCQVWECPQVLVTRSYAAHEGDELELKEGDQASILVSLADGWYKGMLADGRKGWFPSNICVEVQDATLKRENMKNFMLMEEARAAYRNQKLREQFGTFPRMMNVSPKFQS
ncbi:unnamed protein product [Calicophoron daubneyi]|uniref:Uncharacterized protein n=1 Tax=Calicophoron daubneyi TaxID=300641 RepID=A0AAV2TYN8_CALDB